MTKRIIFLMLIILPVISFSKENKTKNPNIAMSLSVIPGMGQVYNEDYWKAPILFGSAGAMLGIALYYNNQFNETQSLIDLNSENTSYVSQLKLRREFYRDNRDQFYLYLSAVYVISILDAYTGAYLYNFDINEDTSLNFGLKNNKVGFSFIYVLN